jgi:oligopeptide/dipeptide ABC transporter ATP-binding protein
MAGSGTAPLRDSAVLRVEHLVQEFDSPGGDVVHAVSDVSFDVQKGESLGLVGESGCGKSSTMRAVLQVPPPKSGSVLFNGVELTGLSGRELRLARRGMQLVFQDPFSSLNPRWTVEDCLAEPLKIAGMPRRQQTERITELLDLVGLTYGQHASRRPGALSGGQCQRVGIARALALSPDLVIFDEAVSSLDVSIQAQILNLVEKLRTELSLTSVFIAHDLAVVKHVSDRVGVMYLGKLCEIGPSERVYVRPAHPYSAALISAIPRPDPESAERDQRVRLRGDLPSPIAPPSGCRFRTRCERADQQCADLEPVMRRFEDGHFAACHHPLYEPDDAESSEQAVRISTPSQFARD